MKTYALLAVLGIVLLSCSSATPISTPTATTAPPSNTSTPAPTVTPPPTMEPTYTTTPTREPVVDVTQTETPQVVEKGLNGTVEIIRQHMPDLWFYDRGTGTITQYDKNSLAIEVVGSTLVMRDNETGQVVGQGERYYGIDSLLKNRVRWYVVTDRASVELGQTEIPLVLMSEMGEDAYREGGFVVSGSPPVVPFFNSPGEMFVSHNGYIPNTQIELSGDEFELINARSGEEHMIMTLIEYACMVNGMDSDTVFSSIRNGEDVVMSVYGVDWHVSEGFALRWTSTVGDDAFRYSSFSSKNGALALKGSIAGNRLEDGGLAQLNFRFRGPEILAVYEFQDRSKNEVTDIVLFIYRNLVGHIDSDSGFLFVAPIGQVPIPFN